MMEGAQSVSGPHMQARNHLLPQTPANQSIANHPSSGFLNPETPAAPDSAMAPPVPNPTPCSAVRAAPVAPQINTVAPQAPFNFNAASQPSLKKDLPCSLLRFVGGGYAVMPFNKPVTFGAKAVLPNTVPPKKI